MTQYLSQLSLARLLAASLLLGLALGLVYDIFRIRRLAFARMAGESAGQTGQARFIRIGGTLLLHIEDLLFGLSAGVATVILYFALSRGQVRIMAIFGEGIGFLLYRLTVGRLVMACADRILRLVAWILHLIERFLIRPPLKLLMRLGKALRDALVRACLRIREKRLERMSSRETLRYAAHLCALAEAGFSTQSLKTKDRRIKPKKRFKNKQITNKG